MAKYILTEAQIQMVLENRLTQEMDTDSYPAGSDTIDAPWNQEEPELSTPVTEDGPIHLSSFEGYEYLLKNSQNGDLLYTVADSFNGDIYTTLHDFLAIPQQSSSDEDGERMVDVDNWEEQITDEDLANALVNYTNYIYKKNMLNVAESVAEWESGSGEFLLINANTVNQEDLNAVVMSPTIREIILSSF